MQEITCCNGHHCRNVFLYFTAMTLECKNVQKYYGAFLALQIENLLINHGTWWVKG